MRARHGFTLMELLAVLAVLILLAAVILPSLAAFRGDSRPRAAADLIRAELAAARGRAMTEGRPYRVAISADGTRIRRAPHGDDFAQAQAADHSDGNAPAVDYAFEHVTAELLSDPSSLDASSQDDWKTLAVVLPNGTCLDDAIVVGVREGSEGTMRVQIRGLTASARVVNAQGAPR